MRGCGGEGVWVGMHTALVCVCGVPVCVYSALFVYVCVLCMHVTERESAKESQSMLNVLSAKQRPPAWWGVQHKGPHH